MCGASIRAHPIRLGRWNIPISGAMANDGQRIPQGSGALSLVTHLAMRTIYRNQPAAANNHGGP
jgi:hypothetical protein